MKFNRAGIGEVAGSLSMLLVTMALLTGASLLALVSLKDAASIITAGATSQARISGQLLAVIFTQSNSSGAYVWLYNYGWEDAPILSAYVDGVPVLTLPSCSVLAHGTLCAVTLPAKTSGVVTFVIGERSVEVGL